MRIGRSLLLVTLVPWVLAACAVVPPQEINGKYRDVLDDRHNDYRIKFGDSLGIRVYGIDGDVNQENILVLDDGRTDLFWLHDYKVEGKTINELENEVITAYRTQGNIELDLAGRIRIQVSPQGEIVYLTGQFERPGTQQLTTKMTLQEAISAVGGLRVTGDTDWALLRRPKLNARTPDLFRIDLNDESEGLFLLPNDQIHLGRTFLAGLFNYLREYVFSMFSQSSGGLAAATTLGVAF